MPRQAPNLRKFLRDEVVRNRLEVNPSRRKSSVSIEDLELANSARQSFKDNLPKTTTRLKRRTVDSLFGEERPLKLIRDTTPQLPTRTLKDTNSRNASISPILANTILQDVRGELKNLLTNKERFSNPVFRETRERLINKIRELETEEAGKGIVRPMLMPPQPICVAEKRQIKRTVQRASRAVAGLERSSKKRKSDIDDDMDGEERLRQGKRVKARQMEITGRWTAEL